MQASLLEPSAGEGTAKKKYRPPTPVMEKVAARSFDYPKAEKVFSPEQIEDILLKRADGEEVTKAEQKNPTRSISQDETMGIRKGEN